MTQLILVRRALALASLVFLVACGGGSADPTAQPFVAGISSDTPQPDRLRTLATGSGSTAAAATAITNAQLFEWAQQTYGDLFGGSPTTLQVPHEGKVFDVRAYASGNFLGVADGRAYGLGPFTNHELVDFGAVQDYAGLVCSVVSCAAPGGAPAAPVLSMAPQPIKTLGFIWSPVAGATEYRLLERADAGAEPALVATLPGGSTGHQHTVFLPERVNASYHLQACNAVACAESNSVTVDASINAAIGYLKASATMPGDRFGYRVALSAQGDTLAIGAPRQAGNSGAVYVFVRTANGWSQQAALKASNARAAHYFGESLALSADGSTLAVGAWGEDSAATGIDGNQASTDAPQSGAVYVFARDAGAWMQRSYIKASNARAGNAFGTSVVLSADGRTLAVGAVNESGDATGVNGNQGSNGFNRPRSSGAVYVFTNSGSAWSQQAYVKASNTIPSGIRQAAAHARFGESVALSANGDTLAVGAIGEASDATGVNGDQNNTRNNNSGAVYVFTRSQGEWSQQAYVKASNTAGQFGRSVALAEDGNTLAVGADRERSKATGIDGDQADTSLLAGGAAYVFTRSGSTWAQQAYVKASNTGSAQGFGTSVALTADGNRLLVGAPGETSRAIGLNGDQTNAPLPDQGQGAAYLFGRNGGVWSQRAYIKASNTGVSDNFGAHLAIAANGSVAAVAAPLEASNATGIGGDQSNNAFPESGAVYLY